MHRMKRKGRQDCIIQCGPVYASSPTGVRALVSDLEIVPQLELVGLLNMFGDKHMSTVLYLQVEN